MSPQQTRFLLLSRPGEFATKLLHQLESHPAYSITFHTLAVSAMETIKSSKVDCLILNLEQFGFRQVRLIEQIRELGYKFHIFAFADAIVSEAAQIVEEFYGMVIFGKRYVEIDKDILGLCNRFLKSDKNAPRKSLRLSTQEKAMIENLRTRNKFSARIVNLSSSGALIIFDAGTLNLNDKLKMIVQLKKVGKTHVLKGQVTWIQMPVGGRRTAGIRFVRDSSRTLSLKK